MTRLDPIANKQWLSVSQATPATRGRWSWRMARVAALARIVGSVMADPAAAVSRDRTRDILARRDIFARGRGRRGTNAILGFSFLDIVPGLYPVGGTTPLKPPRGLSAPWMEAGPMYAPSPR